MVVTFVYIEIEIEIVPPLQSIFNRLVTLKVSLSNFDKILFRVLFSTTHLRLNEVGIRQIYEYNSIELNLLTFQVK